MPNAVKYNVSAESLALKKGDFWIGTGDVGKGLTSSTGYRNGINPPIGGYTIYLNKSSNGPAIYTAANDSQLITLTNIIAGANYNNVNDCLNWFAGQSDKFVANRDYEPIITNGLVFNVDAGYTASYPKNGNTWYDISSSSLIGSLTNGPTFSSANGGSIVFDGSNDYVDVSSPASLNPGSSSFSVEYFCRVNIGNYASCAIEARGNSLYGFLVVAYYPGGYISLFLNTITSGGQNVYLSTTAPVQQGVWFHTAIVANRASSEITFYYNGTQTGGVVSTVSGSINGGGNRYWVGGDLGGNPMSGNIAILRQYNRVLSASEVLANYNAQKGRFGL